MIEATCFECGEKMTRQWLQADPHEPPERYLVCEGCGHREVVPADIVAHDEERARMPGL